MRVTLLILVVGICTLSCESVAEPEPPVLLPAGPAPLVEVPGRDANDWWNSGMDSVAVAVRNPAAWDSLWTYSQTYPVPPVDFSESMVLVVASGVRGGHGWTIRVDSALSDGAVVFVHYAERVYCATTGMQVRPWHAVVAPRHDGPVTFIKGTTQRMC